MKAKVISIILIISLCLFSCAKAPLLPGDTTGEDDGIQYPAADTKGTNITYLKTDAGFIPISFCTDGLSMLSGENYYYNLQNLADNDLTLTEKQFTVFTDNGVNRGGANFADVCDNKITDPTLHTLATSANWKLCPNLKKTSFSENTADSGYKQYILETFPDKFKTADDVFVKNLWEYDLDADGTCESVVLADTDTYTVMVFLSQTLGNTVLASSFDEDDGFIAVPFVADLDGNGAYSLVCVWGNSLKTVTVFKEKSIQTDYTVYLPIDA